MAGFFRTHDKGLDIFVRLTPRAARDAIGNVDEGADGRFHLNARVRAVPEKGAANAALEKLIAGFLGVPQSTVCVIAGTTARLKTIRVAGNPDAIASLLRKLTATAE
ncbi:DUF167 domain-containing protein [Pseudaminobacter arsenicus]|uniref:UPF0235 protein EET67_11200 n=1 Tax=Borborobacter arsenicus TaxID=1851146 RepID=A0A432V638_9HYPH|nr:DUF167 family protein [Pseudaminobacter arsenicus]RUM97632.1 DUF167 domain-containing protein [Pseudaminobacter arsenicus]